MVSRIGNEVRRTLNLIITPHFARYMNRGNLGHGYVGYTLLSTRDLDGGCSRSVICAGIIDRHIAGLLLFRCGESDGFFRKPGSYVVASRPKAKDAIFA